MTAAQEKDIADSKKRLEYVEKVVIIGNGEPPLRETVRHNKNWIDANLELPNEVEAHTRWIGNFNRIGWIVVTVLIGIFLQLGCASTLGLSILLYQFGLLKVP